MFDSLNISEDGKLKICYAIMFVLLLHAVLNRMRANAERRDDDSADCDGVDARDDSSRPMMVSHGNEPHISFVFDRISAAESLQRAREFANHAHKRVSVDAATMNSHSNTT